MSGNLIYAIYQQLDLLRWCRVGTVGIIYFRHKSRYWLRGGGGGGGAGEERGLLVCIFIQLSGHGQTVFPRPRSDDDYTRGGRLSLLTEARPETSIEHHQAPSLEPGPRQSEHDQLSDQTRLGQTVCLPCLPGPQSPLF